MMFLFLLVGWFVVGTVVVGTVVTVHAGGIVCVVGILVEVVVAFNILLKLVKC